MTFHFSIPHPEYPTTVAIEPGSSAIFVGANGSGKTRLAVFVEEAIGERAHRISAHRALNLNPAVPKIRGAEALRKLRFGHSREDAAAWNRNSHRWQGATPAVAMLNDFDSLLQALFADQSVVTLETHQSCRSGTLTKAKQTKFEALSEIWQRVLPHRKLVVSGDDIRVSANNESEVYPASEMSDGERAIFYLVAQALVAEESSLLVVDEPELHVHPSIMSSLWDEIEAARSDCAFMFITHDLHFTSARSAKKYAIRSYLPTPTWEIEIVPDDSGFSEELATRILGSRRPILFVEGSGTSLDFAIYRCCYPDWTLIPRGSCEQVVHAVVTMRSNAQLTRVMCAGIVDADGYSDADVRYLNSLGVFPLPVSEVENVILLPKVSRAIAYLEGFSGAEIEQRLSKLEIEIFATLQSQDAIDDVVLRYCRRRIDRILKKIDLSKQKSVADLDSEYKIQTGSLSISDVAEEANSRIRDSLANRDLPSLLAIYDNKGLLSLAAQHLRQSKASAFEGWLTRMLRDEERGSGLIAAFRAVLPSVEAS